MNAKVGQSEPRGQDPSPPTRRVIAVMELLAGHHDMSLALADICRELGISRSTGHAILHTLCANAWALRDPVSGKYSLGPAVATLSRQTAPLSRLLRDPLHRLCRSIDMPVCISEVRSQSIVVVDAVSPSGTRPPVPAGLRLPFLAPFGREFVAWAPAAQQKEWVAGSGPVNDVFRARIPKVLKEIRERGYGIERLTDPLLRVFIAMQALDDGNGPDPVATRLAGAVADLTVVDFLAGELTEATPGPLATISAPIFDAAGRVVMSVSAQPYRQLTTEQVRAIGAQVMEFARTAGVLVAQHWSADQQLQLHRS
jgi:DNA-binding IclR family transcriptional regulator